MLKQSSPTAQVKPNLALEDKAVTPVSQAIGLTELAVSLEALNLKAGRKITIVHCTQTGSPSRASGIPRSQDQKDQKKS